MSDDLDTRKARLLDQLDNQGLSPAEIKAIEAKLAILDKQLAKQE